MDTFCAVMGNVKYTALKSDHRDLLKIILLNKKPSVTASFENSYTSLSLRYIWRNSFLIMFNMSNVQSANHHTYKNLFVFVISRIFEAWLKNSFIKNFFGKNTLLLLWLNITHNASFCQKQSPEVFCKKRCS